MYDGLNQDPNWAECQEKVVDRIVDGCGRADIDGAEIHRIIGILETNAYEINSQGKSGFRGLFPLVSASIYLYLNGLAIDR